MEIGGHFHDNNWPGGEPIVDWNWADMDAECNPKAPPAQKEPSALSEGIHTALDVLGMIPVVGEIADGANALLYAAEGNYTDAALSAASMVPLAGNVVGAAKLAKRGMEVVEKVRGLKKVQTAVSKVNGIVIKSSGALGDVKKAKIVREITKGEKIADIVDEAKYLTRLDDAEHAVIKLSDGKRVLVSGGRKGIILPADTKVLYGHTHPPVGKGELNLPSMADREALDILKQSKQYVFHDGTRTTIYRGDYGGIKDVSVTHY